MTSVRRNSVIIIIITLLTYGEKQVCFLCVSFVTDISAMVAPIGVQFCMMGHICPGSVFFPFGGGAPEISKSEICPPPVWLVLCFANALDFVALVDARGNYVLNGNFIVSAFHKELHVSGTILEYSGSGTIVERINGTGVIYEDIYVHVRLC